MVFNFRTPSFIAEFIEENMAAQRRFLDEIPVSYLEDPTTLKRFSMDELKAATRNFSHKNILGEGGFGTVYRGKLIDGSLVAVKRVRKDADDAETQFNIEVRIGSNKMIHHPNLLQLRGFCSTKNGLLLVYPLMANNSLECHLGTGRGRKGRPLDWPTRKRIALGVARGLAHLHDQFNPKIIHRDICPANILLDEEFEAVVGDFGLARIMNEEDIVDGAIEWSFPEWPMSPYLYKDTYVNTSVRGPNGYIAAEYRNSGKCSQKSDVFAYGALLLELMSGQRSVDPYRDDRKEVILSIDLVEGPIKRNFNLETSIDCNLRGEFDEAEARQLIELAWLCASPNPAKRPTMAEVIGVLEGSGKAIYRYYGV